VFFAVLDFSVSFPRIRAETQRKKVIRFVIIGGTTKQQTDINR
jgi:hypothetical protein